MTGRLPRTAQVFLKLSRIAEAEQLVKGHSRPPLLTTVHGTAEEILSEGNPSSLLATAAEGFASADCDRAEADARPLSSALSNGHPLSQLAEVLPDGHQARVPFPFFDTEQLANRVFQRSGSSGERTPEEPSSNVSHSSGRSNGVGAQAVPPASWTA